MPISVYSVNSYLKNDATLTSIAGKQMNFFPVIGYGTETAPFVIYYYNPGIPSVESYWNRYDTVRYSVYDSDVDRLFRISERMITLLGAGDKAGQSGGVPLSDVRVLSSQLLSTSLMEPLEKEGWYQMDLDFNIYSVSN
jgi:hypothetical protein